MSEVRVDNIVDYGGKGAPTFDNGAVISGVSSLGNQAKIGSNVTITSGGINVSGVTTAATLSGNLTGDVKAGFLTATSTVIGSGVTINAGGLNITGVVTATTFEGSGANMTGVAMSIAPLAYDPDPSDTGVIKSTGIGITFDHRILAGSGNITISVATNAGAAGTVVENFGVGSSVTIQGRRAVINPTSNLTVGDTYHISYPSGAFTNTSGDVSYVGTAYTFGVADESSEAWVIGANDNGSLGINKAPGVQAQASSPIQIPGAWSGFSNIESSANLGIKSNGTIWAWGYNTSGQLGQNNTTTYSSPIQIPGTTWTNIAGGGGGSCAFAINSSGEMYAWGKNTHGQLGQNQGPDQLGNMSSPIQIPGTTWSRVTAGSQGVHAVKTDGTLWSWGQSGSGSPGLNSNTRYSSPTQVPGTTWTGNIIRQDNSVAAIKSDGTLWTWGYNDKGQLGQNNRTDYSSPKQVPGTTWSTLGGTANTSANSGSMSYHFMAIKTDGTLWAWGSNGAGELGLNEADGCCGPTSDYSSPVQVPGTTWSQVSTGNETSYAIKTDGTAWSWGNGDNGRLGHNNQTRYSSPIQIGSDTSWSKTFGAQNQGFFLKDIPLV